MRIRTTDWPNTVRSTGVDHDQAGHADGGGRCEQRVEEGQRLAGGRERQPQQEGTAGDKRGYADGQQLRGRKMSRRERHQVTADATAASAGSILSYRRI
jgi:hypothetical protein